MPLRVGKGVCYFTEDQGLIALRFEEFGSWREVIPNVGNEKLGYLLIAFMALQKICLCLME